MLPALNAGAYAAENRLTSLAPCSDTVTQLATLLEHVLNENASYRRFATLPEPENSTGTAAFGAPQTLATPSRFKRLFWVPVDVETYGGVAGGAVASSVVVIVYAGGPIGT